jgi:hypothetical protein
MILIDLISALDASIIVEKVVVEGEKAAVAMSEDYLRERN